MVEALFLTLGLILCIFGLTELIHAVSLWMCGARHRRKSCSVIWLKPKSAWEQLRYERLQMRWLGKAYTDVVIAITDALDPQETLTLSRCFTDGFIFCPSDAVINVIMSITGENHTDGRCIESATDRGDSGSC